MIIKITPSEDKMVFNIILAIWATHNHWSHDKNVIEIENEEGHEILINTSVNYIEYKFEDIMLWTENIDIGDITNRLVQFIYKDYSRLRCEFIWLNAAQQVDTPEPMT